MKEECKAEVCHENCFKKFYRNTIGAVIYLFTRSRDQKRRFNEIYKKLEKENLSELQMRNLGDIFPSSGKDLLKLIKLLNKKYNNDYGKAAECLGIAANAAFNYMACLNGCTGFQANCAVWSFCGKVWSGLDLGARIIKYQDLLYPQSFNDPERFPTRDQILESNKQELAKAARDLIKVHYVEYPSLPARPYETFSHIATEAEPHGCAEEVMAHWKYIASLSPEETECEEEEKDV